MSIEETEPRALRIPDVARRLGWTETATRRAIERGQLPSRRWGARVVVLADELERFLTDLPRRGNRTCAAGGPSDSLPPVPELWGTAGWPTESVRVLREVPGEAEPRTTPAGAGREA
jgi:predicted DNA-binding transcriptional regulator AlpA